MVDPSVPEEFVEMRTIPLGACDVLLVRAGERVTVAWLQNVHRSLKRANPDWNGTIVVLGIDQDLEHLPEPVARKLFDRLKLLFE
jgi:hypothetical protein